MEANTKLGLTPWPVFERVIDVLDNRNIPFALAGGQAMAFYTDRTRASKDVDFIILPEDRGEAIDAVKSCGFDDYFDRLRYDRKWIFRACRDDIILDLIWAMSNQRTSVGEDWMGRGPVVQLNNKPVRVIPAEELLWMKIYVLQRDRSDWPDLLNLLYARGETLDWRHVLDLLGPDSALFSSLMIVFCWLRPDAARRFPRWIWRELHLPKPDTWTIPPVNRESLLDTREWFPAVGNQLKEAV